MDVVFDAAQHLEESIPVEFELGDVLFDLPRDLIDGDEEGQLSFTEGVNQFFLIGGDTEDALTVGDEPHLREMDVHFGRTTQVVPGSPHPLHGHPVVEQAANHPQRDEIAEGVEASPSGPAAGGLHRWLNELHTIPVTELMRCTTGQAASLLSRERFQFPVSLSVEAGQFPFRLPVPIPTFQPSPPRQRSLATAPPASQPPEEPILRSDRDNRTPTGDRHDANQGDDHQAESEEGDERVSGEESEHEPGSDDEAQQGPLEVLSRQAGERRSADGFGQLRVLLIELPLDLFEDPLFSVIEGHGVILRQRC